MRISKVCLSVVLVLIIGVVAAGCSSTTSMPPGAQASTSMSMPDFVTNAPVDVKAAYQYAAANPEELAKYPCFCGCVQMGHTSNKSCYIKSISSTGQIVFDNHAAGCGICVDITKDVMRMKQEGKASRAIRDYIDANYSQFGPGTNTPLPTG